MADHNLQSAPLGRERPLLVVAAAALGTMFEWYDFFLYGALASVLARHFFAGLSESAAFAATLGVFAAGFVARPFGALLFGRLGDVIGRKRTFLATMTLMGVSTFCVALLPGADLIGAAAPIGLIALRVLQGLAIGGEYGGAAIYVAEHAPSHRRAFYTSWINAMATAALIASLLVIIGVRMTLSERDFEAWGWRAPFGISIILLGVSLWIRLRLQESPIFQRMQKEGAISKAPIAESLRGDNLRAILSALFGAIAGGTTIWFAAHFYTLFFLERVLKVEELQARTFLAIALIVAAPSYLFFGWLSDRIGRKAVLISGCVLAALTLFPAFQLLTVAANPALAAAQRNAPVSVYADARTCSFQFDPIGAGRFNITACDIARAFLARAGVNYRNIDASAGAATEIHVGARSIRAPNSSDTPADRDGASAAFEAATRAALESAGYPTAAAPSQVNAPLVIAIIAFLVMLTGMNYAPLAAFLVELFPARIRYTSVSLPYHVGTGWIGGLLPTTAFAMVAATGSLYAGLWYPVCFATLSAFVLMIFLPETRGRSIDR